MSNDNGAGARRNRIRGPQSALTDFLAANNISAAQITREYQDRLQQAQNEQGDDENLNPEDEVAETEAQTKKRKRKEALEIAKIKESKAYQAKQRMKKNFKAQDGDDGDDKDDEDYDAWNSYKKAKKLPGQLENCDVCSVRFTVTGYSKEGPNGGLLCPKCSKQLDKDSKGKRVPKKPVSNQRKGKEQRKLMDGERTRGAKSLQKLCIEKVADHNVDLEDLGDLPERQLNTLSGIFTKRRILDSRTIALFLRPEMDTLRIEDAGKLSADDFERIIMTIPHLKSLYLENAGQFKNRVLKYATDHPEFNPRSLRLHAMNLIDNEHWERFFAAKGAGLEELSLYWIDHFFNDDTMKSLISSCRNLKKLKLKRIFNITSESLASLVTLHKLEHLTLRQYSAHIIRNDVLVQIITAIGSQLHTLSLDEFTELDDSVLEAIHINCRKLTKLRITGTEVATDAGFQYLFHDWENPALSTLDLSKCRHVDASHPSGNEENPVGLCSDGFQALMSHSSNNLANLNLKSCRHISHDMLLSIFNGRSSYPHLKIIDFSFVSKIDDTVLAGIWKSCPAIEKVYVFGCFNTKDIMKIPKGALLIGWPAAHEGLLIEGGMDV